MTKKELEILKMRFVDNMTLEQIGAKYGNTRQRSHQQINEILEKLYHTVNTTKWEEETGVNSYGEELQKLLFIIGKEHKDKITRLITALQIDHPSDFAKYRHKDLMHIRGLGERFLLQLKLALLKMGYPYDNCDMEEILSRITALKEGNTTGLKLRFKILKRDGFRCHYCGKSPHRDPNIVLHVDHIKPLSKGGTWDEKNLITACAECNMGKSNTETITLDRKI